MPLPTNISDATRRLNPQIFGTSDSRGPLATIAEAKKSLRQKSGDGMNNWEREYLAVLDIQWSHIHREVSLPLANGLRYKVDFLVVGTPGDFIVVEGHEVKGHARSTGIAKLKMAARLYPWIKFKLVTKKKRRDGGGWDIEPVLP